MDWKSVEMQVAMPRTYDAAKLQSETQQRGLHFQDQLAASAQAEQLLKRSQIEKSDTRTKAALQQEESRGRAKGNDPITTTQKHVQEHQHQHQHPYKGKNIDFTG